MNSLTKTMKQYPKEDRPYEKCYFKGPEALSEAELLAVIIRSGTKGETSLDLAREILSLSGGLLGLIHFQAPQLTSIKGIGPVKAVQLLCIAELSKRIARSSFPENVIFHSPQVIADYYMERLRHMEQEIMLLCALNTKNKLLKDIMVFKGSVRESLIMPREIFLEALKYQAVSVVLLHNHPSGDPTPSRADISVTRRLRECGEILGIPLLDHIIIGDNQYISLKEQGIL